jgi:hypothetical protein
VDRLIAAKRMVKSSLDALPSGEKSSATGKNWPSGSGRWANWR